MHGWFLVLWLTSIPTGIQIEPVASKEVCINVGSEIKKAAPYDVTFMCVENAAKKEEQSGHEKPRKHR